MADNFENLGPRWYVIHTYSGYENKVKTDIEVLVENRKLQDRIFEVMVPAHTVTHIEKGQEKQKEERIFPCYVLVRMEMTDETWHAVRNITGVTGFVGPGSKPVPLSDREVRKMGITTPEVKIGIEVGDAVLVHYENFDMEGTVSSISDDKRSAKVNVSMFGSMTLMEVDTKDLVKVNK